MEQQRNERPVEPWEERLANIYDRMKHYTSEAVSFKDQEDLHQARVNNRKLLTIIEALRPDGSGKLLPPLKKCQKLLGRVRDRDVLIERLKERKKRIHDKTRKKLVKQWIGLQKSERKVYRKNLRKRLPKLLNQSYEKQWNRLMENGVFGRIAQDRFTEHYYALEHLFDDRRIRYEQLKQERGMTDSETMKALHKMRITVKKLRYLLMQMDDVIEFDAKANRRHYEELQDQLGGINDVRVEIENLKSVKPRELAVDPEVYRGHIAALSEELTEALGRLHIPKTTLS